jgi:hypothetical protein
VSFLTPLWLALGAAAAIPILLHLLRLRRGVRVDFPAVRFLLRAMREHRRELRLRNLALMLLRVAIVLVLALAAARPLGPVGGAGHAPTAIALVLDNSMSTGAVRGGGAAIETLRSAAERILDAATAADRVWLLTLDRQVDAGGTSAARDALGRVEPMGGAGDLAGTIERAASVTRGSGLASATIVVLTDGQASEWQRAARVAGTPVTVVAITDAPPKNRAVREARPTPVRWVPRGALEVAIASADSSDVRVALGDRTLARSTLGPDGTMTVRGSADHHGWLGGRVELAPDELRGDDVRYFAVFAGDAPAVHIDPSAGAFARGAIETLADAGRMDLGGSIAISGAEQVTKRPVLAFAPSDVVRLGAANRALTAAGIPWRFGDGVRDETSVRGGELDGVSVHIRHPLIATGAAVVDTLANAGGAPWVVAGDGYVLVGSPLDPSATSLPVSAQLLPWLESLVARYLLTDGGRVVSTAPLARVSVPLGVDEIMSPEQQAIAVHARNISAPERAGVYWMRRGGAVVGALVVNAEPAESNLAPLSPSALADRIVGTDVHVLAPTDAIAHAAFATSARRPLAGILFVVLAVLLVVETVVARARKSADGSVS